MAKTKTTKKSDYGFSSVSVHDGTITRLRNLREALTQKDMRPPSMDEIVNRACTALETELGTQTR